jgi:hypothetical protein
MRPIVLLLLALLASGAQAQAPAAQRVPTDRERSCEAQATLNKLRGQTRRNFIADCAVQPRMPQGLTSEQEFQRKVSDCARAGESQPAGATRRQFVDACVRKPDRDPAGYGRVAPVRRE